MAHRLISGNKSQVFYKILVGAGLCAVGLTVGLDATGPVGPDASAAVRPKTVPAGPLGTCAAGVPTITVQGTGSVSSAPDQLTISLGVQTSATSADAALKSNDSKSQALITTLVNNGVPRSQIQTQSLSVQPNYNNRGVASGPRCK